MSDNRNEGQARLNPGVDEIRRIGKEALDVVANYYDSLPDLRVYPSTTARDIRERLDQALPEDGEDSVACLRYFAT